MPREFPKNHHKKLKPECTGESQYGPGGLTPICNRKSHYRESKPICNGESHYGPGEVKPICNREKSHYGELKPICNRGWDGVKFKDKLILMKLVLAMTAGWDEFVKDVMS